MELGLTNWVCSPEIIVETLTFRASRSLDVRGALSVFIKLSMIRLPVAPEPHTRMLSTLSNISPKTASRVRECRSSVQSYLTGDAHYADLFCT